MTSTESGLSVPDWPTTYGSNMWTFPISKWVGGIRYEHVHRLVASFVGFLTVVLAFLLWRFEPRRWVRRLGYGALAAVVAQGVLGGMTVLFLLPTWISVAHACLAQLFFCLTVAIAVVTSPRWAETTPADLRAAFSRNSDREDQLRDGRDDLSPARDRRRHAPHQGRTRHPRLSAGVRPARAAADGVPGGHPLRASRRRSRGGRSRRRSAPCGPSARGGRDSARRRSPSPSWPRRRSRSARRRCSPAGRSASPRRTWPWARCCSPAPWSSACPRSPPRGARTTSFRSAAPRWREGPRDGSSPGRGHGDRVGGRSVPSGGLRRAHEAADHGPRARDRGGRLRRRRERPVRDAPLPAVSVRDRPAVRGRLGAEPVRGARAGREDAAHPSPADPGRAPAAGGGAPLRPRPLRHRPGGARGREPRHAGAGRGLGPVATSWPTRRSSASPRSAPSSAPCPGPCRL